MVYDLVCSVSHIQMQMIDIHMYNGQCFMQDFWGGGGGGVLHADVMY